MLNRPPRRPRHGGAPLRGVGSSWNPIRQQARHDVESPLSGSPSLDRVAGQPGMRAATNPLLLSFVDGLCGEAMIRHGTTAPYELSQPPALDLDEDEHRAATHDQVDLYAPGADVACDDAISLRFEKLAGTRFTLMPQFLSSIGHGSIRREGSAAGGRAG